MKKGDKSGQFYLVAAIIIIGLIIGFAVINNYSSKKSTVVLEEEAEELAIEGEKVLDYEEFNSLEPFTTFKDFAKKYSIYSGEDKEIYFIVGEGESFEAYRYEGETLIDLDSSLTVESDKIIFNLDNVNYEFKKEKGKNFYFLMTQKNGGEKYVIPN